MDSLKETRQKYIFVIGIFYFINIVSAYDPFTSPGRLLPCFKVIESATCNKPLFECYQSRYPSIGLNEPDTRVYLFTPNKPDEAEQLDLCCGQLPPDTQYDPSLNTEIFIHGGTDGLCRTAWMREMKEQLFQRGKYNVILVDWTWGNNPDPVASGGNLKVVGDQVGFIINNIMNQTGAGPEKFHVIAHSLGADAAGFVGRSVPGLRRITALDPSLAPFLTAPPNERITYRDAEIVDVIHGNSGNCVVFTLADARPVGHADFYPNGGAVQLSCYTYLLKSFLKGDFLYALASLVPQLCYHLQTLQYYKVSINPNGCEFVGVASESYRSFLKSSPSSSNQWAVMGMDYELYQPKNTEPPQKYYLNTKLNCPYYADRYLGKQQFPFNTSCSKDVV